MNLAALYELPEDAAAHEAWVADFAAALTEGDASGYVNFLFGVLIAPGLELAFDEREQVRIEGHTVKGERVTRTIPVCGPAAFVVLKAFAFGDRAEPKDAFDLVYVIRRWVGGADAIADRLARHFERHRDVVSGALDLLVRDFSLPDLIGPLRVAEFEGATGGERDEVAADAHGYVDDLMSACLMRGLRGDARQHPTDNVRSASKEDRA